MSNIKEKYIIFGNGKKYKILQQSITKEVLLPKETQPINQILIQNDQIELQEVQQNKKKKGKKTKKQILEGEDVDESIKLTDQ